MHSRSSDTFPSRTDPRRSYPVSMNTKIQKSMKPLKSGPSPTSVTSTKSFQYDNEEPFDCGPSSQRDQISKRNAPAPQCPAPNAFKQHSSQTRTKVPPLSPRSYSCARSNYTDRPPKSPTENNGSRITTQKASTFRQRRMQIARQRKWTEDQIEKIQYHSLERSSTYLVEEEVYGDPEEVNVSSSHEIDEDSDDDSAIECMTIDTVSSLNTNWTNRSDDAFSARSWLPPKLSNGNGMSMQKRSKDSFPLRQMSASDSIHPPLYVSSKKYRKQVVSTSNSKTPMNTEPNLSLEEDGEEGHFDPEVTMQINNIGRDRMGHQDSTNDDSANLDDEPSMMDENKNDISIISSYSIHGEKPSSQTFHEKAMDGHLFVEENENDIPMVSPSSSIHRERPSPQTFLEKKNDEPLSLDEEKEPSNLRKKRLSRMFAPKRSSDVVEQEPNNERQSNVADIIVSENSSEILSPKSLAEISVDRPGSQPFDESAIINLHDTLNKSSYLEKKLDSDLHNVMEQRELDDDKSIQTSKSFMTMGTLKTCFTTKPTSPEELEIAMKRKKHRMYLFHHALNCTHPHPENDDDESYVPCPVVKHCHALSILVRHVQTCTLSGDSNGGGCEVPRCNAYKKVWNHYRRCAVRTFTREKKDCRFCSEFWHKREQN